MHKITFLWCLVLGTQICLGQGTDSSLPLYDEYFTTQKEISRSVSKHIYSNFPAFNSLDEKRFTFEVDSLRDIYFDLLNKYSEQLGQEVVEDERKGINYYFDKLILEYPLHHETYSGEKVSLSGVNQERLDKNIQDFNKPELLLNRDFLDYVRSFISRESNKELVNESYARLDNKYLNAFWNLSSKWFHETEILDYWRHEYLSQHIENMGIKNIEPFYDEFIQICQNTEFINNVKSLYNQEKEGREGHLIKTYKQVDGFDLDIHLFLPDTSLFTGGRPAIVYFHGGSWSEGKPDWFFSSGENYANQGWVAAAVEYRIMGRHGTLPFQSVLDAKSAIRWLRANAEAYNIDSSKLVATGNSAGGHLVLATALVDSWNEKTDNLDVSPIPDVLMVTSGVYDLTIDNSKWIVKDLDDKSMVYDISPNHLLKSNLPPMLLIHGENDMNCPYPSAEYFASNLKDYGNEVEFHTVEGAGHFIWFGRYSTEVSEIRREYLERLGFD